MTVRISAVIQSSPLTPGRFKVHFPDLDDRDRDYLGKRMEDKSLKLVDVYDVDEKGRRPGFEYRVATFDIIGGPSGSSLQNSQGCFEFNSRQSGPEKHERLHRLFSCAGRVSRIRPGFKARTALAFCNSEDKVFLLMPRVKDIQVFKGKSTKKAKKPRVVIRHLPKVQTPSPLEPDAEPARDPVTQSKRICLPEHATVKIFIELYDWTLLIGREAGMTDEMIVNHVVRKTRTGT